MTTEFQDLLRNPMVQGMASEDFLHHLCSSLPQIRELQFPTYVFSSRLPERLMNMISLCPELGQAEANSKGRLSSLWDELAGIHACSEKSLPDDVLKVIVEHFHDTRERTHCLTRQEFLGKGIAAICNELPDNHGLSVCSKLKVAEGYTVQLPMLDFACKPTETNRNTIHRMLEIMGQKGVILNSGGSFHFVGVTPLTNDEWIRFMGRSLLLAPFVDTRYVGHRLLDGHCNLRLFARSKNPQKPIVQASVGF